MAQARWAKDRAERDRLAACLVLGLLLASVCIFFDGIPCVGAHHDGDARAVGVFGFHRPAAGAVYPRLPGRGVNAEHGRDVLAVKTDRGWRECELVDLIGVRGAQAGGQQEQEDGEGQTQAAFAHVIPAREEAAPACAFGAAGRQRPPVFYVTA